MLLEKLCKELGVEPGEEWVGNDGKFYIIEKSGQLTNCVYKEGEDVAYTDWIERVLTGELKPKWKPKEGETYLTPVLDDEIMFATYKWHGSDTDELLRERGLVFKSKQEAIECAINMIELAKEKF